MGNKFNGFPGMNGGNFNNILKQAQKMQEEILQEQENVNSQVFEASVGGGAVTVKVGGDKQIKEIKFQKDAVDPEDIEMLQDLVMSAVNEAIKKVDEALNSKMGKYNIPGLF